MPNDIVALDYPPPFAPYGMPTEVYDKLRTTQPVCRVRLPSGISAWLLTRYEDIVAAHKDPSFSRDEAVRRGCTLTPEKGIEVVDGVLQNMDGERHRRLRGILSKHYGPTQAETWQRVIAECCHRALDRAVGCRALDLRRDYFEAAGREAANILFGFPVVEGPRILELFFDSALVGELRDKLVAALDGPGATENIYFSDLRAARNRDEITTEEIVANLLAFSTATFEAVGAPLLGGVFALLREPRLWQTCTEDLEIRTNAIEEMLRCFSNGDVQFLRVATEDRRFSGVEVRTGDAVMAPVTAANMDPTLFPNPRTFDIQRLNANKNVAFSVGPHHCIAWRIVKTFMDVAVGVLLTRLVRPTLAVSPVEIRYRNTSLICIMEALPVNGEILPR